MPHYTEQQIEAANNTSLVAFLTSHGEQLKKFGAQHLWEKHQVWIRDNRWYTHYDAAGGYAISFVMKYYAMDFQNAVAELLGGGIAVCNTPTVREKKPTELVIPKANTTMNRVYAYLMNERFISREVISFFAHERTLYEDEQYHNCIFVGVDENGIPKHIHRRGTHGSFKQTESGSKAEYSFHHDGESEWLLVFEAPIDMLAFITLHQKEWMKHSYVALCSVSERAILHRLKINKHIRKIVLCLDHDNAGLAACMRIRDILVQNGYNNVRMLHSVNKDWDEDVKAMNGITPIKAESDETEAIRKLCREFISEAKELRKPPQLYNRICDVFTSLQNRMPHVSKEQIEKLIGLLLLLSKDECRKSLNEVSWDEIYEMLIREYIPHADNGNTEIRIRQIATDMNELAKVYEIPSMFNEIEIFTKPILKTAMDCIRLINYLERKEKPCKESKH